jgi:alpha-beta hydrolase superfamily lysophospholipase
VALTLALTGWRTDYDRGWDAANHQNLMGYTAYGRALANVRHDLRARGADVQAIDRARTRRGC